jgi:site-specific DNA recombinase
MIAAVYVRKSTLQTGRAEEERSATMQLELARAYAARHGLTIAPEHVYVEKDGSSGAEFETRDQFMALIAALKPRPPFAALILYDKDRLGREMWEMAFYLKKLDQAGVRIHESRDGGGPLRFDSPTDRMMMSMLAGVADLERERTRVRTRDALRRKAARGHVAGGKAFGYANVVISDAAGRRSHVVRQINEDEAASVRRIFTLASEGLGLKAIARQLNAEQALAPNPRRSEGVRGWATSSVREILHRELYRGAIVWGRKRKRDAWGQQHVTAADESTVVRHHDEALRIVPEPLWQAAQARIAETRSVFLRGMRGTLWGGRRTGSRASTC